MLQAASRIGSCVNPIVRWVKSDHHLFYRLLNFNQSNRQEINLSKRWGTTYMAIAQ